jgi:broad specificity phosphatase PhoE
MAETLPLVYLVRHGETVWSLSGQHTGRTDLPLTERGEQLARQLGTRLKSLNFVKVLTSPLQRAARTCELAGFKTTAEIEPNLVEWDYGQYEGVRSAEIHAARPDWLLFRDGCPGGESPAEVAGRADAVIRRVGAIDGNALLLSSVHILRVLAARWLGLEPLAARYFTLDTASVSILSFEHNRASPVVRQWNDTKS